MRRFAIAILFGLAALSAAPASAAGGKLIYKVDQALAVIEDGKLVISANGAVRSGGWERPHLRVKWVAESNTLEVEFLASPPSSRSMVIQAILPVQATLDAPLPREGAVQVKVISETNSVTVPIESSHAKTRSYKD